MTLIPTATAKQIGETKIADLQFNTDYKWSNINNKYVIKTTVGLIFAYKPDRIVKTYSFSESH